MSVSKATAGALCFSTTTLLISLYSIYIIYSDVHGIWMQLDEQMVEIKVKTDDIWTQMLGLGAATASTRQRRQGKDQYGAYEAQGVNAGPVCACFTNTPRRSGCANGEGDCDEEDDLGTGGCPPGPPGPEGGTGLDGVPGHDGVDGHPGEDADDWQNAPFIGCFHCPTGKAGAPGERGKTGVRGMRGSRGTSGMPGSDGYPGSPGQMGPTGPPGENGRPGPNGEKGQDLEQVVPRKGPRGIPGEGGETGPDGDPGKDGAIGEPGPPGNDGPLGFQGAGGRPGEEGTQGVAGRVGTDAAYCPCPGRNHKKREAH
ncbi:hypothetical protein Angca_003664, partial [Angiostrongylus cantonensis]